MQDALVIAITLAAAACGGGTTDSDRICEQRGSCGATEADVDACKDRFDRIDGSEGALAQCADCMGERVCAAADDACELECEPVYDALTSAVLGINGEKRLDALSPDELGSLCGWAIDRWGGGSVACGDLVVGDAADCEAQLVARADRGCGSSTASELVRCLEVTNGDVCAAIGPSTPLCDVFFWCWEVE
jgi:hypothetical protein